MLDVKNLRVSYGGLVVVDDLSFTLGDGEWLMLVGPNGAGKSTVVSAVSQGASYRGSVVLNGTDVKNMRPRELARSLGVLTQNHSVGYSFTVSEVVRLGRYAYSSGALSRSGAADEEKIARALEVTGMLPFAEQSVLTLSGGELQRTFLAQLFAQDPSLLILDEPTNHLDLVYQKQVFELIRRWIADTGRSVISVVHDLSLARAYGTRALLMHQGRLLASGGVDRVLNRENLEKAYSIDVFRWMRDMLSQWEEG
jgi:iron complex transport system ATP-binding protein